MSLAFVLPLTAVRDSFVERIARVRSLLGRRRRCHHPRRRRRLVSFPFWSPLSLLLVTIRLSLRLGQHPLVHPARSHTPYLSACGSTLVRWLGFQDNGQAEANPSQFHHQRVVRRVRVREPFSAGELSAGTHSDGGGGGKERRYGVALSLPRWSTLLKWKSRLFSSASDGAGGGLLKRSRAFPRAYLAAQLRICIAIAAN